MTDYFALLGFEHQPWVDAETVKARFLEFSTPLHPDRFHGGSAEELRDANQRFAELNAAATCLRDAKERVQHLLQLETGSSGMALLSIPPELLDLFARVGQTCRAVDQFHAERAKSSSPMLQAQLFAQGLDWSDRLAELQTAVSQLQAQAESELKELSAHWPEQKPIEQLRRLAHIFATANRWEGQLKERYAALAG